jgi:HEAT repeat protein
MQKIIALALMLNVATAYAQDAYKDSLLHEEDEYVNTVNKAAAMFLNKKLSTAERIKAMEPYSVIYDQQQVAQFKTVVLDSKEPSQIRAVALDRIYSYATDDQQLTALRMEWLGNPKVPAVLRREALQVEQVLTFSSMQVADVYEKMLTDPEAEFRLFAFTKLIIHGDARAQQLLIQGLENPKAALMPAPDAIGVLSMAQKKEYYPALYKLMRQTKDEPTRLAAIQSLGFYQPARADIITISLNPNEKEEFREAALGALYAADRDNIVNYVLPILADKRASFRLQAVGIQMSIDVRQNIKYRVNAKKADRYDLLIKSIAEDKGKAAEVQAVAAKYMELVKPKY